MPWSGDVGKLRQLKTAVRDLGRPDGRAQRDVAGGVIVEVRAELREEFATGVGPYGAWQRTVRGRQALKSRKLPQDFRGAPIPSGARFWSQIPWLMAHQVGHIFAAQQIAANTRFLSFKNGRLIRRSRVFNKKGLVRRGVEQTFAPAHIIRARILVRRAIYPDRGVPPSWAIRINRGAEVGMNRWYTRALG